MQEKIRICGVGNVLLGDDAAGPYAVRWMAANYECANQVESGGSIELEDLGTPGLDLVAYLSGVDVLILIDSVNNGEPPGTVIVYDKAEVMRRRPAVRLDPHSPCITESLFIAELAGDAPKHVYLIGITGEQFDVGAPLSDSVRNAIPAAAHTALERAACHGGVSSRREPPQNSSIWWEAAPDLST
jgi:hydrogenase maturation protease